VELAASWVRLLSCQEIAGELEKNLDFLQSTTVDLAERHQSLRAVFDYSWALLDGSDQEILGRLSVFTGAFDRPAAEAVTGATVQALGKLADYSLLQRRAAGPQGVQRYEILESLRHFASEKQQAAAQGTDRLSSRYSDYYLQLLADRLDDLHGERVQAAADEIAHEITNIRAAWRLAIERQDLPALAGALESLALFYYMRSWFAEGERSFALAGDRLAIQQLATQQRDPERQILRGRLMAWQGWFGALRGQVAAGHELLQRGVALLRQQEAQEALAGALPYLAVATSAAGDNLIAEQLAREARESGRQQGNTYVQAVSANVLSQILFLQGDTDQARAFGQESLALLRESGNTWSMAFSLANLGRASFAAGDYAQASAYYEEAIEIREALGDMRGKALGLLYLGDAALAEGNHAPAHLAYRESLLIFRDIGSRSSSAEALARLGHLARQEGLESRARREYAEALELAQAGQAVWPMLEALLGLARVIAAELPEQALLAAQVVAGHPATAETSRQDAVRLATQLAGEGVTLPVAEDAAASLDEVARTALISLRRLS
jgi:tetratricopeptide (TPR) repeat protein